MRVSRLPSRVQLAQFICVALFDGLPGLLLPHGGEENPAEERSKASISGRQKLSKHGEEAPVSPPAFIILRVCRLPLMKLNVIFISFPVFTSSLGFRIVVDVISRGGEEEERS